MKWRNKYSVTPTKREYYRYYCTFEGKWAIEENYTTLIIKEASFWDWLLGRNPKLDDDKWVTATRVDPKTFSLVPLEFDSSKEAQEYIKNKLKKRNYKPVYMYVRD